MATKGIDLLLMNSDPIDIVGAIALTHSTVCEKHRNLWWAVDCNRLTFPIGARPMYCFVLSPAVGTISRCQAAC